MVRLEDLTLFVRAAALGSFSNVAREVDVLPAQVSVAIKRLEKADLARFENKDVFFPSMRRIEDHLEQNLTC